MRPEIKEAWRQMNPTERKLNDLEAFEEGYHWGEDAMRERAERLETACDLALLECSLRDGIRHERVIEVIEKLLKEALVTPADKPEEVE